MKHLFDLPLLNVACLLFIGLPNILWANEPVPPKPAEILIQKSDSIRVPMLNPDPRKRTTPELICNSNRIMTLFTSDFTTKSEDSFMRLRLDGTQAYMGNKAGEEKVWSSIYRSAHHRWTAGTATFTLNEELTRGTWTNISIESVTIRSFICKAFGDLKRL